MKKKLISFCTAVIMAASCISAVSAASVKDVITSLPKYESDYKNVDLDVDADIEVKNGSSVYADGPVTVMVPSGNPSATFDYRATLYMEKVRDEFTRYWTAALALCGDDRELLDDLDNVPVSGEFEVKITYPSSMVIPDDIKTAGSMVGFNDEAKNVFKDTERTVSGNVLTIKIKVKDPSDSDTEYVSGKVLHDNLTTYLADLTLTCEGVTVNGIGRHRIKGEITGYTKIGDYTFVAGATDTDVIATVNYTAVQDNTNTRYTDTTDIVEDVILVTPSPSPTPYYGGSSSRTGSGGLIAGNNTPISPTTAPSPTIVPGGSATFAELDSENHFAYIIGYPEGDVRPENNISRAEVATIFFRMFTDESRAAFWTKENNYYDVNAEDWFNNAISTISAANIVNGYEDGTFKPNAAITRAEFAAIAAKFISGSYSGPDQFSDISGHWAAESINRACVYGWINGYEDGTFKPDQKITRAEAMTLMNNVLNRHVGEDGMVSDMITWVDNTPGNWYYTAIQEATNSHYYDRADDSSNEVWSSIRDPRDWAALETEASTASSAGSEASGMR